MLAVHKKRLPAVKIGKCGVIFSAKLSNHKLTTPMGAIRVLIGDLLGLCF